MTALKEYERLECTGLWKESPTSQRKEVLVLFGNNSLVLRDTKGVVISHWSLPAVKRINVGKQPALYKPGEDSLETLEIEDNVVIKAISKITNVIEKRRPRHGKIRLYLLLIIFSLMFLTSIIWLPEKLRQHTISITSDTSKKEVGQFMVRDISNLTGVPCGTVLGNAALVKLKERLVGNLDHTLLIIPNSSKKILSLPGNIHLIDKTVIEDYDTPEVVAGFIFSALERAKKDNPFEKLIKEAHTGAVIRFLATGKLTNKFLQNYSAKTLIDPDSNLDYSNLLKLFQNAKVATSPYSYAIDVTGETTSELIKGDPYLHKTAPLLISDTMWLSLQTICE